MGRGGAVVLIDSSPMCPLPVTTIPSYPVGAVAGRVPTAAATPGRDGTAHLVQEGISSPHAVGLSLKGVFGAMPNEPNTP